jgi:hypothetical protein
VYRFINTVWQIGATVWLIRHSSPEPRNQRFEAMMEYPEIVCIYNQMRETLIGTPIERFRFEGGYCYVCPTCRRRE